MANVFFRIVKQPYAFGSPALADTFCLCTQREQAKVANSIPKASTIYCSSIFTSQSVLPPSVWSLQRVDQLMISHLLRHFVSLNTLL